MSTKINVRSPYYLDIQEPTAPSVELTCALIALSGFSVDEFGNVSLPDTSYGDILSYTSTDSDFANGKFATVSADTSRTVTFRISIPPNFTNSANDYIDCDAITTQPKLICTGGVTTNGSIPNQALNTGGNTATINLSSYFTQGSAAISGYNITNTYPTYVYVTTSGNDLLITTQNIAGTVDVFVEAFDSGDNTCSATQPIQITITATDAFTCTEAALQGGIVNQDGSIIKPNSTGTVGDIRTTPTGSPITSLAANNTGSFISHTLYFDITVPTGYTNTGATVQCSKNYDQVSSALPLFDCDVANLTGQAIYTSGAVLKGNASKGTISGFSPIDFLAVDVVTARSVTFSVTPPASGYSNSGGSDISCPLVLQQPTIQIITTVGSNVWYYLQGVVGNGWEYIYKADNPSPNNYWSSIEGYYDNNPTVPKTALHVGKKGYFIDNDPSNWIGSSISASPTKFLQGSTITNAYYLVTQAQRQQTPIQNLTFDYYIRVSGSKIITEVWKWYYNTKIGIRIK
tara:strand:- start:2536 stop:4083 length:1548 start_codon:yes stop_codon:yes gene_type:complete